jgi:hypothetical protein
VCTYCVTPNYYDPQLAICRPNCTKNQQLDINTLTCVCIGGYSPINGTCQTCPAYSIYNQFTQVCDCVTGYTFQTGICVPQTSAPIPPSNLPVSSRPCADPNAFYQAPNCVCLPTYHLIGGLCVQCANGTFFDPSLSICRIPCQANQVYNSVTGACACAQSYYLINGNCSQCTGNTTYNAQTSSCGCPTGYRVSGGFCVIGCGVNQVLSNGQCCCITGFYPVNGVCGQCSWNQVYD